MKTKPNRFNFFLRYYIVPIVPQFLFIPVLFFLSACTRPLKQRVINPRAPKVVEARGYVVPKDSMAEPKVIRAGKPRVVPTNTNPGNSWKRKKTPVSF